MRWCGIFTVCVWQFHYLRSDVVGHVCCPLLMVNSCLGIWLFWIMCAHLLHVSPGASAAWARAHLSVSKDYHKSGDTVYVHFSSARFSNHSGKINHPSTQSPSLTPSKPKQNKDNCPCLCSAGEWIPQTVLMLLEVSVGPGFVMLSVQGQSQGPLGSALRSQTPKTRLE